MSTGGGAEAPEARVLSFGGTPHAPLNPNLGRDAGSAHSPACRGPQVAARWSGTRRTAARSVGAAQPL